MKIVCYSLKHLKPVEQTMFRREMYGFKDISNKGRYVYRRAGIMSSLKHKMIFYTGLLVEDKDAQRIIRLLRKHKAKIHVTDAKSKSL